MIQKKEKDERLEGKKENKKTFEKQKRVSGRKMPKPCKTATRDKEPTKPKNGRVR